MFVFGLLFCVFVLFKSPIVPVRQHPEFCNGSIEHALVELNRIHESEAMQVNGRLADLELR